MPFISSFRCWAPVGRTKCSPVLIYLVFPRKERFSSSSDCIIGIFLSVWITWPSQHNGCLLIRWTLSISTYILYSRWTDGFGIRICLCVKDHTSYEKPLTNTPNAIIYQLLSLFMPACYKAGQEWWVTLLSDSLIFDDSFTIRDSPSTGFLRDLSQSEYLINASMNWSSGPINLCWIHQMS